MSRFNAFAFLESRYLLAERPIRFFRSCTSIITGELVSVKVFGKL